MNPKTLKKLSDRIQSGAFEPHVKVIRTESVHQTYTAVVNDRAEKAPPVASAPVAGTVDHVS